jgi:hypothetical protein
MNIDEIIDEYDDLTGYVRRSDYDVFASNLASWYAFLNRTSPVDALVKSLENSVNYDEWSKTGLIDQRGTGHGRVKLPSDPDMKLGILIGMFRRLAGDERQSLNFAHSYASSARNFNENINDLVGKLFDPLADDLRRRIRRIESSESKIPASDRFVNVNHNSPAYKELEESLEELEKNLIALNDYDDPEDKEQRIAEISAGRRLLKATRVRIEGLLATVGAALRHLLKKTIDTSIGKIVSLAVEKLISWAPAIWTFFSA